MKVFSVVGARLPFVKLAPIAWQLTRRGDEHLIVRTGRHHDHPLSHSFFDASWAATSLLLSTPSTTAGRLRRR